MHFFLPLRRSSEAGIREPFLVTVGVRCESSNKSSKADSHSYLFLGIKEKHFCLIASH